MDCCRSFFSTILHLCSLTTKQPCNSLLQSVDFQFSSVLYSDSWWLSLWLWWKESYESLLPEAYVKENTHIESFFPIMNLLKRIIQQSSLCHAIHLHVKNELQTKQLNTFDYCICCCFFSICDSILYLFGVCTVSAKQQTNEKKTLNRIISCYCVVATVIEMLAYALHRSCLYWTLALHLQSIG